MKPMKAEVLRLERIRTAAPFAKNLQDVSLYLCAGEAVNIFSVAGAGEDSLMAVLTGRLQPSGGRLLLQGENTGVVSPRAAIQQGIYRIAKEPAMFEDMTVADHVYMSKPKKGLRFISAAERERVRQLLLAWEMPFAANRKVRALTPCQKHLLGILCAAQMQPRVVLVDDFLGIYQQKDRELLLKTLGKLLAAGCGILNFTSRLDGLYPDAQRNYLLQNGTIAAQLRQDELPPSGAVQSFPEKAADGGKPPIQGNGRPQVQWQCIQAFGMAYFSLEIQAGECLGIYDKGGKSSQELTRMLLGLAPWAGTLHLGGKAIRVRSPQSAARQGIVAMPPQVSAHSLLSNLPPEDSLTLPVMPQISRVTLINRNKRNYIARKAASALGREDLLTASAASLSPQDTLWFVLLRCLVARPKLLVLSYPDRYLDDSGLDILCRLLEQLRQDGMSILFFSDMRRVLRRNCSWVLYFHEDSNGESAPAPASREKAENAGGLL